MTDFEREDMELQAIMGGKFVDATKEPAVKPVSEKQSAPVKDVPTKENPVNARVEPVKPSSNFMDKLKQTAKDVCLYAVLSMVLFWWQQSGRLEENTAWYALLVCVGMVFFSVGKNWRGWCE